MKSFFEREENKIIKDTRKENNDEREDERRRLTMNEKKININQ